MSSDIEATKRPSYRSVPMAAPNFAGPDGGLPMELALDAFPVARTQVIALRREDKEVFDALQAWWHFRQGKRLTQWELFSLLLADALENADGRFADARLVLGRHAT